MQQICGQSKSLARLKRILGEGVAACMSVLCRIWCLSHYCHHPNTPPFVSRPRPIALTCNLQRKLASTVSSRAQVSAGSTCTDVGSADARLLLDIPALAAPS